MKPVKELAVFGGGCFWCTEAAFQQLRGVSSVVSGYAGGSERSEEAGGGSTPSTNSGQGSSPQAAAPSYEDVSTGKTGHAEVVKIEFDPTIISYEDLLTVFFVIHDPTTLNRQGNDAGTQYRSIILYSSDEQKKAAEELIKELDKGELNRKIVTEVKPLGKFFPAEEYHRNYYLNNPEKPYCQLVISPKLDKLKEKFSKLLKSNRE